MSNAYATTNLLTGLAAGAFVFSAGTADSTRTRLVDGKMAKRYVNDPAAASGVNVIIDLGAAVDLTGFAVLNSNCAVQKSDATLKVESASAADMGTNLVVRKAASTLNHTYPKNKDHVVQFISGTARRYWRLTWTWTGTVTNFAIGEIWAFAAQTQMTRGTTYGVGSGRGFKSAVVDFYNGGSSGYRLGGPILERRLPYADMTSTELEQLGTLHSIVGDTTPFLWIESYEATATAAAAAEQEVLYGKLGSPDFLFTQPDFNLYTPTELSIRSLGREIGS